MITLQYIDTEGKKRWGYILREGMDKLINYHEKLKELQSDSKNEILRKNLEFSGKERIELFLSDGRTGSPELKSVSVVAPFVSNDEVNFVK